MEPRRTLRPYALFLDEHSCLSRIRRRDLICKFVQICGPARRFDADRCRKSSKSRRVKGLHNRAEPQHRPRRGRPRLTECGRGPPRAGGNSHAKPLSRVDSQITGLTASARQTASDTLSGAPSGSSFRAQVTRTGRDGAMPRARKRRCDASKGRRPATSPLGRGRAAGRVAEASQQKTDQHRGRLRFEGAAGGSRSDG